MPPPPVNPKNPPDWFCTCRKCGSNGKVLSKATWYRHNPSGKKAKYEVLSNKEMESIARISALPTPVFKARKRRFHEDVEVEDPISKRVAGSGSVRITSIQNICAPNEQYL
jgi:hypothetical protein